jgi:hypothetical protein
LLISDVYFEKKETSILRPRINNGAPKATMQAMSVPLPSFVGSLAGTLRLYPACRGTITDAVLIAAGFHQHKRQMEKAPGVEIVMTQSLAKETDTVRTFFNSATNS